jgi:hypothetical protein
VLILLVAFAFWIAINGRLNLYGYLAAFNHGALVKSVQSPAAANADAAATASNAGGFNSPGMSQFNEAAGGASGATADNVNPTSPGWAQFLQRYGVMGGAQ